MKNNRCSSNTYWKYHRGPYTKYLLVCPKCFGTWISCRPSARFGWHAGCINGHERGRYFYVVEMIDLDDE